LLGLLGQIHPQARSPSEFACQFLGLRLPAARRAVARLRSIILCLQKHRLPSRNHGLVADHGAATIAPRTTALDVLRGDSVRVAARNARHDE
jgi:hypothetical protein